MLFTQQHSRINGRGVWHYLIDTAIGHIHVVEYEQPSMELKRFIIDADNDKAERKYTAICKRILNGNL